MKKTIYTSVILIIFALVTISIPSGTDAAKEPKHKYVGIQTCKKCHKKAERGNQVKKWEESAHAKAYKDLSPTNPKALEGAKKKGVTGNPQEAKECLKCHVTAYGVDSKWIKVNRKTKEPVIAPADGVQCESCHGPGDSYKKIKIMRVILEERMASGGNSKLGNEKGLIIPTEETCTACHNDESPYWNPVKYTTKDGKKVGFDFAQAKAKIAHPIPEAQKKKAAEETEEGEENEE